MREKLFAAYRCFENKLYGRMLGKGYHLVAAGLLRWLLRASIAAVLCFLFYSIIIFIFKILFSSVLSSIITIFVSFFMFFFTLGLLMPTSASPVQVKQEEKTPKHDAKKNKPLWGKKKPSFGSWAWVVEQQKKEEAYHRKMAQQAQANRIAQEQMRKMINGGY